MASQARYWQPDFDPAATYVVAAWPKGYTVRGEQPKRGEIFDKTAVSLQILRSHYEARWIDMVEPAKVLRIDRTTERVGAAAEDLLTAIGDKIANVTGIPEAMITQQPPVIAPKVPKASRAGRGVV